MSENEKQSAVSRQPSAVRTQHSVLVAPEALEALRERLGPRARLGERLAPHTSYRIGGPADLFLPASRTEQVVEALQAAHALGVPCRVIGGASNLLVADDGIAGLVVKSLVNTTRYVVDPADPQRVTLVAAAGCQLAAVARQSARRGLAGLVWASNVPGTVGAAVVNNAGAFGGSMAEVLERALLVDAAGQTIYLGPDELAMAYRSTRLKRRELDLVVLEAELRLRPGDAAALEAEIRQVRERRQQTQPAGFSAGSMFANPPGDAAGRLIEAAGLKGARVGGAVVSPLHANFIVNEGGASARDVYTLMRRVQEVVYARMGVWLIPEVQLVGRWRPEELAALATPVPAGAARVVAVEQSAE
ncbi:MAG TPA: UDP-N-acetylmuramate dehydrogenase [Chloroflexota bacterium]|nr:UDP-N-acetylmuramate dehydrogenase [Chloroflexota bacterium]